MASSAQHNILLSPAELAYLHSSLSLTPPLRPDGRAAPQFRPLSAETDILPGTNGSARICFADGTEAIVGVKAEVDKTRARYGAGNTLRDTELITAAAGGAQDDDEDDEDPRNDARGGESGWVEIAVEIPGTRDDEASTVYLAEMLAEALLADGEFVKKLWINRRFHWKLYLDVCGSLYHSRAPRRDANLTDHYGCSYRFSSSHPLFHTLYLYCHSPLTWLYSRPDCHDSSPKATKTRYSTTIGTPPHTCTRKPAAQDPQ